MKINFTSLQTETVQYFVLHSGIFVAGLGLLFFLLGLIFGGLTWRRYRRRWLGVVEDEKKLRSEVSDLQKLLAEREVPNPAETQEKETPTEPEKPQTPEKPAVVEMPDLMASVATGSFVAAAVTSETLPKFEIPSIPDLPAFVPDQSFLSEPEVTEPSPTPVEEGGIAEHPAESESFEDRADEEPEMQPFSFLLSDEPEEESAAEQPDENVSSEAEMEPFSFIIEPEEETESEITPESNDNPGAGDPKETTP